VGPQTGPEVASRPAAWSAQLGVSRAPPDGPQTSTSKEALQQHLERAPRSSEPQVSGGKSATSAPERPKWRSGPGRPTVQDCLK